MSQTTATNSAKGKGAAAAGASSSNKNVDVCKLLVKDFVALQEILKENDSEEHAEKRKGLNEEKKTLQEELLFIMKRENITNGKVDLGSGLTKYLRIYNESRPRPVTAEVAKAAVSNSINKKNIKSIVDSLVPTLDADDQGKPTFIKVLYTAIYSNIKEFVEHRTEKVQITESKKRSRNNDSSNELFLPEDIQAKTRRLYTILQEVDSDKQVKKRETQEMKEKLDAVRNELMVELEKTETNAYNFSRQVDGEIKMFHVKLQEDIEPKNLTITHSPEVIESALESVFKKYNINPAETYNDTIPEDVIESLGKYIETELVTTIEQYQMSNARVVRKLQVQNGRSV